jgi:hypothetical protein
LCYTKTQQKTKKDILMVYLTVDSDCLSSRDISRELRSENVTSCSHTIEFYFTLIALGLIYATGNFL